MSRIQICVCCNKPRVVYREVYGTQHPNKKRKWHPVCRRCYNDVNWNRLVWCALMAAPDLYYPPYHGTDTRKPVFEV